VLIFLKTDPSEWVDSTILTGTVAAPVVCEMATFLNDLLSSAYMDTIGTAYSVPGSTLGRGVLSGVFYLPIAGNADDPPVVLDSDIQKAIVEAVASHQLPQPNANTCYIVLPPGEVLWDQGLTGTTAGGGGYHKQVAVGSVGPLPYCVVGESSLGTAAITHELVEAITDSDLSGWKDVSSNPEREGL
jgi:hypothetical protein